MPRAFIRALGLIKATAAQVNRELGLLDAGRSEAIARCALQVADGLYDAQFPIDVFQTGSGTSTNINAHEEIGRASCRERVCQYVEISVVGVSLKKKQKKKKH